MLQTISHWILGSASRRRVRRTKTLSSQTLESREFLSGSAAALMTPAAAPSNIATISGFGDGDDTASGAIDLGVLTPTSGNARRFGSTGFSGDPQDYYRFQISGTADVRVALESLTQDLDFQVQNSSGVVMFSGTASGTSSDIQTRRLSAGTYYLRVYPGVSGARSSYTISVNASVQSTTSTRKDFSVASNAVIRTTQTIERSGQEHWYKITITRARTIDIQMGDMGIDLDLEIRSGSSASSQVLASSRRGGTRPDRVTTALSAGTYWIRVVPSESGTANYTIDINLSGRYSETPKFR